MNKLELKELKKNLENLFNCKFIERKTIDNVDYRSIFIGWKFINIDNFVF